MKQILKEPLVHFLVLGALLFGAYAWLNRGASGTAVNRAGTVRVTTNEVAWLKATWARQWQREPTRDELRGLVTEYLKEELLAREARTMGLDENDLIVRRRLAQKLEFLVQDTSRLADPTEDDLRRFYAANPERFAESARVSFTHVYFSRDRRKDAAADARAALAVLSRTDVAQASQPASSGGIPAASSESERGRSENPQAGKPALHDLGDRLLIDPEILNADEQTVSAQFGKEFAGAVFALQPDAWHGPIESGYGLHLVRVSESKPAKRREFADVKTQVLEHWREQRQREDNEKYFAGLLKKYDVVVDENLKPLVGPLDAPIAAQWNGSGEEGAR